MKRREFLAVGAATGTAALAGCTGSQEAPPRESKVFSDINLKSTSLTIQTESSPLVQTRMSEGTGSESGGGDTQGSLDGVAGVLGAISPIGVASAAKGGRGRGVPRGSNGKVITGRNGRVKWRGGKYAGWWDEHRDEVKTVNPAIAAIGVSYLAQPTADEDSLPGAGKPPEGWDKKWAKSEYQGETLKYKGIKPGWFRVGGHLEDQNSSRDFGWEAVDLKIGTGSNGFDIKRQWKVSPSL